MILSFEFELRQIALFCGILPSEARSMINKMTKNIKPQIDEANEIAKSLAQEVQFDFKLTSGGSKDTMNL